MLLKEVFSKETFNLKNLVISLVLSVFYVIISTLFSLSDFATTLEYGDVRPAIFFPALISILYGPIIGGIAAGFGNLLYDIVENVVIEGGTLTIKNLVGFLANLLGGIITGGLARSRYKEEEIELSNLRDNFKLKDIALLFYNVLAGVIGFGITVGLSIGLGLNMIAHVVPFHVGVMISLSIIYWNSLFLFLALPLILAGIIVYTFYMERYRYKRMDSMRRIKVSNPKTPLYEIMNMEMPLGDELFYLHWGAIRCFIKNTQENEARFFVRLKSLDYVEPQFHTTPILKPQEEDEVYFNVYGLGYGNRKAKLLVSQLRPDEDVIEEFPEPDYTHTITYTMNSDHMVQLQKLMNFFLFFGVVISIALFGANLLKTQHLVPSKEVYAVFLIIPVEIIIIILYYWLKSWKLTRYLMNVTHAQASKLKALSKPKKKELTRKDWWFISVAYFIGTSIVVFLVYLSYQYQVKETTIPKHIQYFTILAGSIVIVLFLVLEVFLEFTNAINEPEEHHVTKEFIQSYVLPEKPTLYRKVEIKTVIKNVTNETGLRVFIHSYDIVTPKRFVLESIKPNQEVMLSFTYIPLGIGLRELSFEFLNLYKQDKQYIPLEQAITLDQEAIKFSVSKDSIFGLTPEQISLLKRTVTLGGAVALAVTFVFELLKLHVDPSFIQTTVPLLLLLQAPVLYILFYFANKSDQILQGID